MDFQTILKLIGAEAEPFLEQMVNGYWPKIDAAIASIPQADEKLLLSLLSPVIKSALLTELKKHLAAA